MGREDEEGVSSSRPELVALAECLEDHEDNVSLLYLTDGCQHRINPTNYSPMDRLRSETQTFQITRRGRPQENYNQTTVESSCGSGDAASESQSSQGGPSQ